MATEITTPTEVLISFLHLVQEMGVGTDSKGTIRSKKGTASSFSYDYVSLPKLLGQVHAAAKSCGFAYSNVVGRTDSGHMSVTHILLHPSGRYEQEYAGPKVPDTTGVDGNQQWGATRTYAVRTTLMSFCGVHHDPDWDGDWMSPTARDKAIDVPSTASTGQWLVDPLDESLSETGEWDNKTDRNRALAAILTEKLPQFSSDSHYTGQERVEMQQFLTVNEALWATLPPKMLASLQERATHIGLQHGS